MKTIHNNPYRIAGVYSNASTREITRNKGKINAYTAANRDVVFDVDFPILNKIKRTTNNTTKAFADISANKDKVNNSLFWFTKVTPIDETVFTYLKNGDNSKAEEIWSNITNTRGVNEKSFSAFNNLGTLKLLSNSKARIKEGIDLKIRLIEDENFNSFILSVADDTYEIKRQHIAETFINELISELSSKFSSQDITNFFSNAAKYKSFINKKFTEGPISEIEAKIKETKQKRNSNNVNAYNYGIDLYNNTKEDLSQLKSLLSISNFKYKIIADNLAKELLQCAVNYFNALKDHSDPSKNSLKLLRYAKSIAIGSQVTDRINNNIEGIEEWAKTAPVKKELDFIIRKIEAFQQQTDTPANAKSLIITCKPKLQTMKSILGSQNDFYLQISSAVVNNAQGMIIEAVNKAQSNLEVEMILDRHSALIKIMNIVSDALDVSTMLGSLDMTSALRTRYNTNNSALKSIASQLADIGTPKPPAGGGGGCYIATMAYGDYEHPQVLILRDFRDNVLSETALGRTFIKVYYKYSPLLVEKLKNKKRINNTIRELLDWFITKINK